MEINKLIDALRHCSVKGNSCRACPNYNQGPGCLDRLHAESASVIEAMQAHIDALESERQAWLHDQERNRWIPVTERLPDVWRHHGDDEHIGEPLDFIVFIRGALVPTTLWFNGNLFCDGDGNFYDVTHWMPLPEPPKEGE